MSALTLRPAQAAILIAAFVAAAPAGAQSYRWVDEHGKTTYSNTPPTLGKLPQRIDAVPERVSVYTPDASLIRAMQPDAQRDSKITSLERQLEAERRARSVPPANTPQSAYERCLAERRIDCERLRSGAEDYAEVVPYYVPVFVAVVPRRLRPQRPAAGFTYEEPRIGVDNRPPVGIDNRPPVGIDNRPPVGMPTRRR